MSQFKKNPFKNNSQDHLKLMAFREVLLEAKLTRMDVATMFDYPVREVRDYYNGKKAVPIMLLKKLHKKFTRDGYFIDKHYDPRKAFQIEPKIKPLVNALNQTGLLKTFSSCEGHFKKADQTIDDRTRADVRFFRLRSTPGTAIEQFIEYVLHEARKADIPASVWGYKHYVPGEKAVYVIEVEPFDRLDGAAVKRRHTDLGIAHVTAAVKKACRLLKNGESLNLV